MDLFFLFFKLNNKLNETFKKMFFFLFSYLDYIIFFLNGNFNEDLYSLIVISMFLIYGSFSSIIYLIQNLIKNFIMHKEKFEKKKFVFFQFRFSYSILLFCFVFFLNFFRENLIQIMTNDMRTKCYLFNY